MTKIGLIIYIFVFFFSSKILYSESSSKDTYSKEQQTEKNHQIIIRGGGGGILKVSPSDLDEVLRNDLNKSLVNQGLRGGNDLIFAFMNFGERKATNFYFSGIEYRYNDKFRVLYDYRHLHSDNNTKTVSIYPSPGEFQLLYPEDVFNQIVTKKFGLAYFHPVHKAFNLGIIVRNYNIEENTVYTSFSNSRYRSISLEMTLSNSSIYVSKTKYSGIVPGIGLEFQPFKWLELTYTYEIVNLKGNKKHSSFSSANAVSIPDDYFSTFRNSNVMYKGDIHTGSIVVKPFEWIGIRFIQGVETFHREQKDYRSLNTLNNDLFNIMLEKNVYSKIDNMYSFRYKTIQLEISKKF